MEIQACNSWSLARFSSTIPSNSPQSIPADEGSTKKQHENRWIIDEKWKKVSMQCVKK
jgi:hypothetical protein